MGIEKNNGAPDLGDFKIQPDPVTPTGEVRNSFGLRAKEVALGYSFYYGLSLGQLLGLFTKDNFRLTRDADIPPRLPGLRASLNRLYGNQPDDPKGQGSILFQRYESAAQTMAQKLFAALEINPDEVFVQGQEATTRTHNILAEVNVSLPARDPKIFMQLIEDIGLEKWLQDIMGFQNTQAYVAQCLIEQYEISGYSLNEATNIPSFLSLSQRVEDVLRELKVGKIEYEKLPNEVKAVILSYLTTRYYLYTHPNPEVSNTVQSVVSRPDFIILSSDNPKYQSALNQANEILGYTSPYILCDPEFEDRFKILEELIEGILSGGDGGDGGIKMTIIEVKSTFSDEPLDADGIIDKYVKTLGHQLMSLVQFTSLVASTSCSEIFDKEGSPGYLLLNFIKSNYTDHHSLIELINFMIINDKLRFILAYYNDNVLINAEDKKVEHNIPIPYLDPQNNYFDPRKNTGDVSTEVVNIPARLVFRAARRIAQEVVEQFYSNKHPLIKVVDAQRQTESSNANIVGENQSFGHFIDSDEE